mmetsp:Transcript_24346/g.62782  ORF Transcript_24346/g.62782 Transcript_24346/m.62782 type:complete len:358 (+) Transcript_24346:308-1381(+)
MAGGSECATAPSRSTSSASSVARARSSRSAATRAGSAAPATSASSASSGCRFPASIAAPNAASSAALSGATRATRALSRASGGQKRSGMPPRARERSSHTCSAPSTSVHVMRTPGPAHQRPPPACWSGSCWSLSGCGLAAALSSSSSTHARASTASCSAAPSGSVGWPAALRIGTVAPRVDSGALADLRPLASSEECAEECAEASGGAVDARGAAAAWPPRSAHSCAATRSHLARSAANSGSSSAVPFGCPGGGRGARVATGGMQLQSLRSALGSASNALPTKCQLCTSASRSARNTSRAPDATESDASASNAHAGPRNAPHATQRTSATGAIASSATRPISQNTHNHTGSCCSSST